MSLLWIVALAVLLLNVPFGFWRAGTRKLTLPWLLAVHAPVPIVVGIRAVSGLGWSFATLPVLVGAFFAGQFLGGCLRLSWTRRNGPRLKADRKPLIRDT